MVGLHRTDFRSWRRHVSPLAALDCSGKRSSLAHKKSRNLELDNNDPAPPSGGPPTGQFRLRRMGETLSEALALVGYSPRHGGQLGAAVFSRVLGHGCILGCIDCSQLAHTPLIEDGSTGEPCPSKITPAKHAPTADGSPRPRSSPTLNAAATRRSRSCSRRYAAGQPYGVWKYPKVRSDTPSCGEHLWPHAL